MSSLRRSKSGTYSARKGIPKDVREDYARLYGTSWEAKFFAPAEVKAGEAKSRFNEWLAEVENRINAIRAAKDGQGQSLSRREAHALSGEWYKWYVARHEGDPGSPETWRVLWEVLIDRLEDFAPQWVIEEGWRDLEWTREPAVRAGMRPLIADEAKTAQFLASKSIVLNGDALALFLDCVLDDFEAAIRLLERRSMGDYSTDERVSQFPTYTRRSAARTANGISPWGLFEAWVKARQPAASLVNRWRVNKRD